MIFTDGSSERNPTAGDIAGCGAYSDCSIIISAPVALDQHQTNNTAVLVAAITSLQGSVSAYVAFCTDSSYVHLGATGAARRWKFRGWIGSTGTRVSNVALWQNLFLELDKPGRPVMWSNIHHMLESRLINTHADLLADAGWLANPLFPSQPDTVQRCDQRGVTRGIILGP